MKLRLLIGFVVCASTLTAASQESASVFNFLSLPSSSHAAALGGRNISLIDDDAALTMQNPALLSSVSNNTIHFDFLTYMRGCKAGAAGFTRYSGERGQWGVHTQFVGYGSMQETSESGEVLGTTGALDLCVSGMYSYNLTDCLAGGATGKFIYSKYAGYNSVALAVDLGLNYFDEDRDVSFSAVAANLGGQVKAFGDDHERLPFNLQLGFSRGIAHAPIRIHVTMTDLTRWSKNYYFHTGDKIGAGRILMNHFCLGVDATPSDNFYLAVGYNFRRASEMKAAGSSHLAGFSAGTGINIKKIKVGLSYAKYHVSAHTLAVSLAYAL
ncbi:MAG: type IX secretion system protein PorQ [Bacteroidaceae bacterium]|nr:type IX secretion system protein PorQ [Bacteroidaceae bacterium]